MTFPIYPVRRSAFPRFSVRLESPLRAIGRRVDNRYLSVDGYRLLISVGGPTAGIFWSVNWLKNYLVPASDRSKTASYFRARRPLLIYVREEYRYHTPLYRERIDDGVSRSNRPALRSQRTSRTRMKRRARSSQQQQQQQMRYQRRWSVSFHLRARENCFIDNIIATMIISR